MEEAACLEVPRAGVGGGGKHTEEGRVRGRRGPGLDHVTEWWEIKCSMLSVWAGKSESLTSREAGPATGGFGLSARLESLVVAGGKQGTLPGAGCVVAAWGYG